MQEYILSDDHLERNSEKAPRNLRFEIPRLTREDSTQWLFVIWANSEWQSNVLSDITPLRNKVYDWQLKIKIKVHKSWATDHPGYSILCDGA